MPRPLQLLALLERISGQAGAGPSLEQLEQLSGWSRFHLHRSLRALLGETPKRYTQRLRLERAASALITTDQPIGEVAREVGFGSHEGFTRAFHRRFGCPPRAYRLRARQQGADPRHVSLTAAIGPCVGLFGLSTHPTSRRSSVSKRPVTIEERAPQPALFIRRRVPPSEIPAVLGECLPAVYAHCQREGLALAGAPFCRYPRSGPGLITMECGMPLAEAAPGAGEIEAGELQGGALAVAIHEGGYDTLRETYAQIEGFVEAGERATAGPPWESYLTDPASQPDPADWRTEVCWPVA